MDLEKDGNRVLDMASYLHMINFTILGYLLPGEYMIALCLGIVWEVIELRGTRHPSIRPWLDENLSSLKYLWNETLHNKYMDLLLNMGGYYLGTQLRVYSRT